jgi:hypothetical protein
MSMNPSSRWFRCSNGNDHKTGITGGYLFLLSLILAGVPAFTRGFQDMGKFQKWITIKKSKKNGKVLKIP